MTWANINSLGGPAGTTRYFLDPGTLSSRLDVGPGRQALDGTWPMLIRALSPWVSGRGGDRVVQCFVGSAWSGAFVAPAAGSAGYVYNATLGGGHLVRDTAGGVVSVAFGFYINGAGYFGWNTQGGNTVSHSNPATGDWASTVLAGQYAYELVPSAALNPLVTQVGVTSAKVTWAAPADDGGHGGMTGYRVQAALDAGFTTGVVNLDVGNVFQATMTGLLAGRRYFFRVLSRNAVTTAAGTYGPASTVKNLQMIAETGNVDSWEIFPATPAGIVTPTTEGIRRATIGAIEETPSALIKESNVTAPPKTLATNTYGAKRVVAGLTPGKVYRLSARAAFTGLAIDGETPNVYALGIKDLNLWADPVTLETPNLAYDMPALDFTATAVSHEIAFRLAEAVTETSADDLERFAIWNVSLAEIPSFSPYRLQSIVYESSLLNHFDLANNSVGARWWVDSAGVTQFAATLGTEGAIATFTDARQDGHLEYTDIRTSFDTRNIVNDLTVHQHGAVLDGGDWKANDEDLNFKDLTSIATNSIRQGDMDMSLYDEDAYAGSMAIRVAEIFDAHADPEFIVTGISWNAQENPEIAARLDVYSAIDVIFRGQIYTLRIVNIKHRITPTRWMMDLDLDRR